MWVSVDGIRCCKVGVGLLMGAWGPVGGVRYVRWYIRGSLDKSLGGCRRKVISRKKKGRERLNGKIYTNIYDTSICPYQYPVKRYR